MEHNKMLCNSCDQDLSPKSRPTASIWALNCRQSDYWDAVRSAVHIKQWKRSGWIAFLSCTTSHGQIKCLPLSSQTFCFLYLHWPGFYVFCVLDNLVQLSRNIPITFLECSSQVSNVFVEHSLNLLITTWRNIFGSNFQVSPKFSPGNPPTRF